MADVLSNAGPLMALGKLNRLGLLAELYDVVQIPRAVYDEVVTQGLARGAPDALTVRLFLEHQPWPIVEVSSGILATYTPPVTLESGEIHVLALAQSLVDPLVLLDDEVARAEARRLNIHVRGTLGILVQAHRQQLLTLKQIEMVINDILRAEGVSAEEHPDDLEPSNANELRQRQIFHADYEALCTLRTAGLWRLIKARLNEWQQQEIDYLDPAGLGAWVEQCARAALREQLQEDYCSLILMRNHGQWQAVRAGLDSLRQLELNYPDPEGLQMWVKERQQRAERCANVVRIITIAKCNKDWETIYNELTALRRDYGSDIEVKDLTTEALKQYKEYRTSQQLQIVVNQDECKDSSNNINKELTEALTGTIFDILDRIIG